MLSIWLTLFISIPMQAHAVAGADELLFAPDANLTAPAALTSVQVRADLDLLKSTAARAYAGPNLNRYINLVSTRATSPRELCASLVNALAPVRDAHLNARVNFESCGSAALAGQVGRNVGGSNVWSISTFSRHGKTAAVLAIPTFPSQFDPGWAGFVDAVRALSAADQSFIVDLRGNRGGDDSMGFEMARVLLGVPQHMNLPTPVRQRTFRQTAEAFALQANAWALQMINLSRQGKPVPVFMHQRRDEILSWMERAKNRQFPEEYVEKLKPQLLDESKMFRGRVIFLVDRDCASACETTLQVFENLPGRILVGENTRGAVTFGEMGRVLLPNSKILVSLATMNAEFRDGRNVETVGYAPDRRVNKGGDALDAAFNEL